MIVYLQLIETAEDRSKFEQLYEQYKQLMFYTAFQILKRPQDGVSSPSSRTVPA